MISWGENVQFCFLGFYIHISGRKKAIFDKNNFRPCESRGDHSNVNKMKRKKMKHLHNDFCCKTSHAIMSNINTMI